MSVMQSAAAAALLLVIGSLQAAETTRGILVAGTGESTGKPSIVELSGTVTGEAELASDAITKYRDNRQRAVEAMDNLKIEGLKVSGSGVSINSTLSPQALQQIMQGMGSPGTGSARLQVSEPLKITIEGVDKMSTEDLLGMLVRIVDAGKDAGIAIGPSFDYNQYYNYGRLNQATGLARFRMADVKQLRANAYSAAIKDAREQAERLAALSGVKLGRVVSVREGAVQNSNVNVMYYGQPPSDDAEQHTTTKLEDIKVKIVLQVEFAIE
ncbi:oxidative stress defense protein [Caulifigura coniformis]|uniref:Oxidative stress defense protein n=1 Tax=Caulifigura coniformis TaxID=2527983 RepID=A0A517SL76_9PLAN|nr:SIMPL domain-containing protein [Caulifigura coniformis]QDT56871.1 oxidative stress defense protein [Caulifigura coniformis]